LPYPTLPRDCSAPTPRCRRRLRDILSVALQELIEAELTLTIGAAPGERTLERVTQRNGHRPKVISTLAAMSRSGSPSCAGGSTKPCGP